MLSEPTKTKYCLSSVCFNTYIYKCWSWHNSHGAYCWVQLFKVICWYVDFMRILVVSWGVLADSHKWSVSDNLDVVQCHISFHLHLRDAPQFLHSVFVVQQVASIHCHFELLRVTKNDDLRTKHKSIYCSLLQWYEAIVDVRPQSSIQPWRGRGLQTSPRGPSGPAGKSFWRRLLSSVEGWDEEQCRCCLTLAGWCRN